MCDLISTEDHSLHPNWPRRRHLTTIWATTMINIAFWKFLQKTTHCTILDTLSLLGQTSLQRKVWETWEYEQQQPETKQYMILRLHCHGFTVCTFKHMSKNVLVGYSGDTKQKISLEVGWKETEQERIARECQQACGMCILEHCVFHVNRSMHHMDTLILNVLQLTTQHTQIACNECHYHIHKYPVH
jgi:hypothetical protein